MLFKLGHASHYHLHFEVLIKIWKIPCSTCLTQNEIYYFQVEAIQTKFNVESRALESTKEEAV
jgi:hypothetical protein